MEPKSNATRQGVLTLNKDSPSTGKNVGHDQVWVRHDYGRFQRDENLLIYVEQEKTYVEEEAVVESERAPLNGPMND